MSINLTINMYLHVNYVKWGEWLELKENVMGKHKCTHLIKKIQCFNTSTACFGPCWPIIGECKVAYNNPTFLSSAVHKKTHKIINVWFIMTGYVRSNWSSLSAWVCSCGVLTKHVWMNKDCMNGTTGQVKNIVHEQQMFDIIVKGHNNKEGWNKG